MKISVRAAVLFGVGLFLSGLAHNVFAAVPEPKSEGKYFQGKGTRASEEYAATAGMPVYEYGKGLQWGPVHFKPTVNYSMIWDDNVFYSESGEEKNDIINSLAGDIGAELPLAGGQHLLSAGYSVYQEWFNRFDTQTHTDQKGRVGLNLNYVPFTLAVEDSYERTVSRANTEFTERIERDENAFHSLLEVPFSQFFLENDITNFTVDYLRLQDEPFNHNMFTMYQRIGHDLTPQTQILAEYAYTNIDYSKVSGRNGDANQFAFGMRGNLTELIAYQAWAGAQYRIYDEATRPDFNGFVFRAAVQYQPSEVSYFTLRGDRTPQESTYDGQSFYTRNQVQLLWKRQIFDRIYWNNQGRVGYHEYSRITVSPQTSEEETRHDWYYDAGTGLEYRMPNDIVSVLVDWTFKKRDSNLDGFDYEDNQVSVGVRAIF